MRAMMIVDFTPVVESFLGMCVIAQRGEVRYLGLEAAMKPFVLATALWMIGS